MVHEQLDPFSTNESHIVLFVTPPGMSVPRVPYTLVKDWKSLEPW